jgi:hypothetical protein
LLSSDETGYEGGAADGDFTPAGDTGERRGALHGLADIAKIVHGAVVQRGWFGAVDEPNGFHDVAW